MAVSVFGQIDGDTVYEATLRSPEGAEARVITWGALVRDLLIPSAGSKPQRVVLGLNTIEDYLQHSRNFGVIAGRFANRIAHGQFRLGGQLHQLPLNENGRHCLHGGQHGFGKRNWQLADHDESFAALTLFSRDGDEGFPGNVTTTCVYRLIGSVLRIELTATTDQETPINLCHHSYFNLDGSPSILDHTLQLEADFYTPTDVDLIPTGEIRDVAGTPYDFRKGRPVRLVDSRGAPFHYDINFALRRAEIEPSGLPDLPLARAGTLSAPTMALDVWTTEPGLQVYDGWRLEVPVPGLDDARYGANGGICLEPQHFPDSPNRPHFPTAMLRPDKVYRQVTEYRFGAPV